MILVYTKMVLVVTKMVLVVTETVLVYTEMVLVVTEMASVHTETALVYTGVALVVTDIGGSRPAPRTFFPLRRSSYRRPKLVLEALILAKTVEPRHICLRSKPCKLAFCIVADILL